MFITVTTYSEMLTFIIDYSLRYILGGETKNKIKYFWNTILN